jgi:hypothetical protein
MEMVVCDKDKLSLIQFGTYKGQFQFSTNNKPADLLGGVISELFKVPKFKDGFRYFYTADPCITLAEFAQAVGFAYTSGQTFLDSVPITPAQADMPLLELLRYKSGMHVLMSF